jgi:hypothetical protein
MARVGRHRTARKRKVVEMAEGGCVHMPTNGKGSCGLVSSAAPVSPSVVDRRIYYLACYYFRPSRQGWRLPPADVRYRLRAFHGIVIDQATLCAIMHGTIPPPSPCDDAGS